MRFELSGPLSPWKCLCAGCCTQWLIYDAYAADQEAQRRAESDANKRNAAARKGAAGTHSVGDAREASGAEPSAETVRAHELIYWSSSTVSVPVSVVRQLPVPILVAECVATDSSALRPYLGDTLRLEKPVHGACHGANRDYPAYTQDEGDELGAAVERTARVMERMAYQNSEVELLMDYKVSVPKEARHDCRLIDCSWSPAHMP